MSALQRQPLALQQHITAPAITGRSLLVGTLLSLGLGTSVQYINMIMKGSLLGHNVNTPGALLFFFVFVSFINVLLGLISRHLALRRTELATVYIMLLVANSIPTIGFTQYVLPIIAGVYYFATPENNWEDLIHPHVPEWIAPQDWNAIKHFYEGLPQGQAIPWKPWIEPLLYWCLFMILLYWVSTCLMIILRKQWVEQEKLIYPLVQVPLDMIRDDEKFSLLKPFFKNAVMWAGFAIPFLMGSANALHVYFPSFPGMDRIGDQGFMGTSFLLFRNTTSLLLIFNLGLCGFAFLLNRDIALGFWLFFLLSNVQRGIFNFLGVQSTENLSRFANSCGPYLAHQAMGAMIMLVLSGLWVARIHLGEVCRKAFKADPVVDDAGEVLPYRTAIWGLVVGIVLLSTWLWKSGFPIWVVPVFLFAVLIIFTALTRAVVEGGVAGIRTPFTPADFAISGLGSSALGPSGLIAVAFTYVWGANIRIFFMPCIANALKLAEEIKGNRRPLLWAVALAVVVTMAGSIWALMTIAYRYGGINLHGFFFISVPRNGFNYIAPKFADPTFANIEGWLFTALGAAVMGLLTFVRQRFIWWPVHPLGFATGMFNIMNWVWFSTFVAWLLKTIILTYGGASLYRKIRPFFLGLILGQVSVAGLWIIIDFFTKMVGNQPIGGSFL